MRGQWTREGAKDNRAIDLQDRGLHIENVQVSPFRSFALVFPQLQHEEHAHTHTHTRPSVRADGGGGA